MSTPTNINENANEQKVDAKVIWYFSSLRIIKEYNSKIREIRKSIGITTTVSEIKQTKEMLVKEEDVNKLRELRKKLKDLYDKYNEQKKMLESNNDYIAINEKRTILNKFKRKIENELIQTYGTMQEDAILALAKSMVAPPKSQPK